MKKLFIIILFLLLPCLALATSYTRYIDTDCGNIGDGTTQNCINDGHDPWNDFNDVNDFVEGTMTNGDDLTVSYKLNGAMMSSKEPLGYDSNPDYITWPTTGTFTLDSYGSGSKSQIDVETMRAVRISAGPGMDFTFSSAFEMYDRSSSYVDPFHTTGCGDILINDIDHDGIGDGSGTDLQDSIVIKDPNGTVEIKNCDLHDLGPAVNPTEGAGDTIGIVVYFSNYGQTPNTWTKIHDNTIYNTDADSIQIKGLEYTGGTSKIEIYNNLLYSWGENAVDIKNCLYVYVYQNTIRNTAGWGIGGSDWRQAIVTSNEGAGYASNNYIYIYENFFDGNYDGTYDRAAASLATAIAESAVIQFYKNWIRNCTYALFGNGSPQVHDNIWWATKALSTDEGAAYLSAFMFSSGVDASTNIVHNIIMDYASSGTLNNGIWVNDADVVIKNNLIWLEEVGAIYGLYDNGAVSPDSDYNRYYNPNDSDRVYYNGTAYQHGVNFAAGDSGGTDYAEIAGHEQEESLSIPFEDGANQKFWLTDQTVTAEDLGETFDDCLAINTPQAENGVSAETHDRDDYGRLKGPYCGKKPSFMGAF